MTRVPKGPHKRVCEYQPEEPQVPSLRFTPVGMTILLYPQELQREILAPATELSSRPERTRISYFAEPARITGAVSVKETA
jgi:hypothetical protein